MVTYKKLTYNNSKIQVESAIRDEDGVRIKTNYAKTTALAGKQDTLVSGTNIKTINSNSLLGSGDLTIGGGGFKRYTSSDFSSVFEDSNGVLTIKKEILITINYLVGNDSNFDGSYSKTMVVPKMSRTHSTIMRPQIIKDNTVFYDSYNHKYMASEFRITYNTDPRLYFSIYDIAASSETAIYSNKGISTLTDSDSVAILIPE